MPEALTDEELLQIAQTWEDCNFNQALTGAKLNISRHAVGRALRKAKRQKLIEDDLGNDNNMFVSRKSTLTGPNGEQKLQWVIQQADRERLDALANVAVDTLLDRVKPVPAIKSETRPQDYVKDMCTAYLIGDAHGGAYAWGQEAEEDYDLAIWQEDLHGAIDRLMAASPPTETAIILNLGDWFHADDSRSQTPASGNQLDTDSRWPKVVRSGVNAQAHAIERMLAKHKKVHCVEIGGNHDPHAVLILVEAMRMRFHNNPRLIMENTSSYMWAMEYGKNLIAACHGDKAKLDRLPGILANDFAQEWGRTEERMIFHGHFHSKRVEEFAGCTVEGFRSLVAKDKWHWDQGYRSLRDMQSIILHKEFGEIERHRAGVKLARAWRATRDKG